MKVKLPKNVCEAIDRAKNKICVQDQETALMHLELRNGDIVTTIINISDIPKIVESNKKFSALWKSDINGYYVKSSHKENGKEKALYLHRLIMDAPKGSQVDHINRNPLDNTRDNLRIVTASQNQWNRGSSKNSKSGIRNVHWVEAHKCWKVVYYRFNKAIFLGNHKTLEGAKQALKDAGLDVVERLNMKGVVNQ